MFKHQGYPTSWRLRDLILGILDLRGCSIRDISMFTFRQTIIMLILLVNIDTS
jgi:hypothetical protein